MAIGIDDLDDLEDDYTAPESNEEKSQYNEPQQSAYQQTDDDDNFTYDFLKTKGIDDPEHIVFEDDNGNLTTKSWNNLTRDEQINILNTPTQAPQQIIHNELSDEEARFLNSLRQQGISPSQYLQQIEAQQQQGPVYQVDDLSDDELYILDLESRVGDLTDDEMAQALGIAKQNEELYSKTVEGIRKEYKEREDYAAQQEQADAEQAYMEAYQNYQNQVIDAINNFNTIGNLDLTFDNRDKEDLASFMLSVDQNGTNQLYQALQDPDTLVKVAWFIQNGPETFDSITDYFKKQITLVGDDQYKRGYQDGQKGTSSSRPTVVFQNNKSNQTRLRKTINDLDDDD